LLTNSSGQHRSTDTFDGAVLQTYTMSTTANPRDVEDQISRIIRLEDATAQDKQIATALRAIEDIDKEIAGIELSEEGLEAYKVVRTLLNCIAESEVNRLQQTLEIHTDLHRANSRPK
jgi:RNA processing factor Prp31